MICDRCTSVFTGGVCVCGWRAPTAPIRSWLIFDCAAPNCTVVIRELGNANGCRLCKFCQARGVTVQDRIVKSLNVPLAVSRPISKEELGLDLCETIKKFSEREWLRQRRRVTVTNLSISSSERRLRLDEIQRRESECTRNITELMPKVSAEDARRLITKYETPKSA